MHDYAVKALDALRQKNFAAAREYILGFAETNPLELQHFMIKGLAEIGMQDWVGAHDTFAEAIDYFPHQAQLWSSLARAQEELGQLEGAIKSLQHSLKLKTDNAEAYPALSSVYAKLGKFEDAEAMAHRAYEGGAPKIVALNALGIALMGQDKLDAAEKVLNEALRLDAASPAVIKSFAALAARKAEQLAMPVSLSDAEPAAQ